MLAGLGARARRSDVRVGSKLRNLTSAAMIRAGQLRPLAIVTERRSPDYPDVPTMGEVGFGDIGTLQLLALFAPAGVPKAIVETLHKAAIEAVSSPAIVEKLKVQFMRPVPTASPRGPKMAARSNGFLAEDNRRGKDRSCLSSLPGADFKACRSCFPDCEPSRSGQS
jgi:Tripartite tricarboxylate transporter family receptor